MVSSNSLSTKEKCTAILNLFNDKEFKYSLEFDFVADKYTSSTIFNLFRCSKAELSSSILFGLK